MKFYLLIILITTLLFSCSQNTNNEQNTKNIKRSNVSDTTSKSDFEQTIPTSEDTTSIAASINVTKPSSIQYKLIITRIGRNYEVKSIGDASENLPLSFINYLKQSVKECNHCYGLDKDSIKVIEIGHNEEKSFPILYKDWNLDGSMDLAIPTWFSCCYGNNVAYKYWLSSDSSHNFIADTLISNISNIEIDEQNKSITGTFTSSAIDYSSVHFKIENGKIIPLNDDYKKFNKEN